MKDGERKSGERLAPNVILGVVLFIAIYLSLSGGHLGGAAFWALMAVLMLVPIFRGLATGRMVRIFSGEPATYSHDPTRFWLNTVANFAAFAIAALIAAWFYFHA